MKYLSFLFLFIFLSTGAIAHPMPNSIVNFTFGDKVILMNIQVPIQEFELAFQKDLLKNPDQILPKYKTEILQYFSQHIQIQSEKGIDQKLDIKHIEIHKTKYDFGEYLELSLTIECTPTVEFDLRKFVFFYDAVIHQVSNHFAIVKIHRDFDNGITPEDSLQFGVIQLDIASNTIKPMKIILDKGSKWKGFLRMIELGMHHIYSGTDHLLFIILLILISPLLIIDHKWSLFGGWKYTIIRLLKIITAFTLGHSLTLLIFTFYNFNNFTQPIETLIAITIIITGIHSITPIFLNKEVLITFVFGLIHGSAFGITLNEWGLSHNQKIISLFGFNIGIELMQIIIVICSIPLIFLTKFSFYKWIRIGMGVLTILVSAYWMIERMNIFNF